MGYSDASVRNYVDGKNTGAYESFYENGILKEIGFYMASAQDGEWKEYHENGKLKSIGVYKVLVGGWGRKHGEWKYYDERGRLVNEELYEDGIKVK